VLRKSVLPPGSQHVLAEADSCKWRVQVTNWRSEIMNFTLSLIYPAADEEGATNVSASELVCVLDADQTCSSSFFDSLLRYVDSGDDIAATIAPRIHYNVDADCDIFDHQRVAYYEKTQLGMDAYGFTACMHTNMLLRARALQEIGWFPRHTHSENWELGMRLVRRPAAMAVSPALRPALQGCVAVVCISVLLAARRAKQLWLK
jgi:Glycosyl transferase family 2